MLDTQVLPDPPARRPSASQGPFSCSWSDDGDDAASVRLAGELDIFTTPQFERTLSEAQQRARLVVADLRAVAFLDCSAIHALVDANSRAQRDGGRLVVVHGPRAVGRILTLSQACDDLEVLAIGADEPLVMASLRLGTVQLD